MGYLGRLVARTPRNLRAFLDSHRVKKLSRYTMVSVISTIVSQIAFIIAIQFLSGTTSNVVAVVVGTIPNYELNRRWTWGKKDKSHLWKERMPFWGMIAIGFAVSTGLVWLVEHHVIGHTPETALQKLAIMATSASAFALLWAGKFVIINRFLFVHRPVDDSPPVSVSV